VSVARAARDLDCAFSTMYHPWLRSGDALTRPPVRVVPPTGVAAGIIARSENQFGVGRAPANFAAIAVPALVRNLGADAWAKLHQAQINAFVRRPDDVWLMGARTLSADPDFLYIHARRLLTHVERVVERRMNWLAFEPNQPALWSRIVHDLEAHVLLPLFEGGAFAGETPADSYFIRCDATLNGQREIELGRLFCEVGIAPNVPAEFIVFRLISSQESGFNVEEVW
jgi:phage tail sheath protein FI